MRILLFLFTLFVAAFAYGETSLVTITTCSGTDKISSVNPDSTVTCSADVSAAGGSPKAVYSGRSSTALSADAYCGLGYDVCGTSPTTVLNQRPVPFNGTVKNLYAWFDAIQGSGDQCDFYVRVGTCNTTLSNSAVKCTVANVSQSCSDTTNTAAVTAGQCVQIFFDEVLATCSGTIIWSFEYDPS